MALKVGVQGRGIDLIVRRLTGRGRRGVSGPASELGAGLGDGGDKFAPLVGEHGLQPRGLQADGRARGPGGDAGRLALPEGPEAADQFVERCEATLGVDQIDPGHRGRHADVALFHQGLGLGDADLGRGPGDLCAASRGVGHVLHDAELGHREIVAREAPGVGPGHRVVLDADIELRVGQAARGPAGGARGVDL